MPAPPGPPVSSSPQTDLDGLSEKYWGDILERTVSSNSLHHLHHIYGQSPTLHTRNSAPPDDDNYTYFQHPSNRLNGTSCLPYRPHSVSINTGTTTLPTIVMYTSPEETSVGAASGMEANNSTSANSYSDISKVKCEEHSFQHEAHCAKNSSFLADSTQMGIYGNVCD